MFIPDREGLVNLVHRSTLSSRLRARAVVRLNDVHNLFAQHVCIGLFVCLCLMQMSKSNQTNEMGGAYQGLVI